MIGKAAILAIAMVVPGVAFAAVPAAGTTVHETVDATAKTGKAEVKADAAAKPGTKAVKTAKAKAGNAKGKAAPPVDNKTDSGKKTESKS
jgi:hypothetical protein